MISSISSRVSPAVSMISSASSKALSAVANRERTCWMPSPSMVSASSIICTASPTLTPISFICCTSAVICCTSVCACSMSRSNVSIWAATSSGVMAAISSRFSRLSAIFCARSSCASWFFASCCSNRARSSSFSVISS